MKEKEIKIERKGEKIMNTDKQNSRLYLILGIGVTVISISGILIKLSSAPPLIIAFYRMLISSLIIAPFVVLKYRNTLKGFFNFRVAVVGFFLAVHFYLWISAFEYTSVANAVIFIALQPLFTYILEYFFAKEDLHPGIMSGILLALVGSIIIGIGDINSIFAQVWGDLLAIAGAFFAAAYLFTGRRLREKMEYIPYLYIVYTYACVFLGFFSLLTAQSFTGFPEVNYLYFLGLALGPTLIGHSALNYSVRQLPATIVSLTILFEPVLTTIFAWFILGEGITLMTLLGGIFIMSGIYRAIWKKKAPESTPA
ncbi:MAG: DMT family transporter [Halanaerobiales bacterium]